MLRKAAIATLGYNLLVIAWGAFVRATGSGAGCGSHWPTCNGEVIPRAASVETAIEFTHRLTSGLAFFAVLAVMIAALRSRPKGHPARAASIAAFVLMVLEAAIGAGIVLLQYVATNASIARAGWMAAHLCNTFLLLAAMALTVAFADREARPIDWRSGRSEAWLVRGVLLGTLLVGITGAVTALGDTLFPSRSLAEGIAQDLSPAAHFLIRLRVWHPIAAVAIGLFALGASALISGSMPSARRASIAVSAWVLLQIAGGFLNLVLLAPVWMQLVHLLLADALWIALVWQLVAVSRSSAAPAHDQVVTVAA